MIKTSYPRLVKIAITMGATDTYDSLSNTLREHGIEVTTKAEPPGYILTFASENHELIFKIKYADLLGETRYVYKIDSTVMDSIVMEQD